MLAGASCTAAGAPISGATVAISTASAITPNVLGPPKRSRVYPPTSPPSVPSNWVPKLVRAMPLVARADRTRS